MIGASIPIIYHLELDTSDYNTFHVFLVPKSSCNFESYIKNVFYCTSTDRTKYEDKLYYL